MNPNLWQYMAMFISVQHDVLNHGGFVVHPGILVVILFWSIGLIIETCRERKFHP
jgi:hypothetical protein